MLGAKAMIWHAYEWASHWSTHEDVTTLHEGMSEHLISFVLK